MDNRIVSLQNEVIELLDASQCITISTTRNGMVASRTVDYVNDGLMIAFFTWKETRKVADIRENFRVSLCLNKLVIEGYAEIHEISDERIKQLMEKYQQRMPSIYQRFINFTNSVFITVSCETAVLMKHQDNALVLDHYNASRNEVWRTKLSDW